MKLKVNRDSLQIIPESPQDEAYIEEVLKAKKDGDEVSCKRVNAMRLNCIAYLEVETKDG